MAAAKTTAPASYLYAVTRMRVRKTFLLPREDYMRMLNMDLPEITRFIEETHYKAEIDELSPSFDGIDLVEVALSWNLAKEYQKIIEIAPGHLKSFTKIYLARWDILNTLSILRGKSQGMSAGKIKEILIPAGSLDKVALDRMLAEDSLEKVGEALKGRSIYPVIQRELPQAIESGSFARLENELYKDYYANLIAVTSGRVKGGRPFMDYIRLDIDVKNIGTIFRVMKGGAGNTDEMQEMLIPGGSASVDEMVRVAGSENVEEIIDLFKKKVKVPSISETLDLAKEKITIQVFENRLIKAKLEQMEKLSKRYYVSVCPILLYLEKKYYEVANLRAITRGKESKLPSESIEACLVV